MALTAKQEKFALEIIKGANQADAYRTAYSAGKMKDKTIWKRSSELMADGEVAGRVDELRAPVIAAARYGLKEAMNQAQEAFDLGLLTQNASAMVAAVTLRAKLNGLLVERKTIQTGPLDDFSHDELRRLADDLRETSSTGSDAAKAAAGTTH